MMWNWISQNNEPVNTVLNLLMLIVWALYFQLLLNGYRRSRRAQILINRANGHSVTTRCVVTNMSAEAIYIEGVIAQLSDEHEEVRITCSLTDYGGRVEPGASSDNDGYQGPLKSGESVELGTYQKIIEHTSSQGDLSLADVRGLTLTVVASYGSEERPVAAQRCFTVEERGGDRILLSGVVPTQQIRSTFSRRQIERIMEEQVSAKPKAET